MKRSVRQAMESDLPVAWQLIEQGKARMRASGNPNQWSATHPSKAQLLADIRNGYSWLLLEDGEPIATWAFMPGPEPTYATLYGGAWVDDTRPYAVVHRVAGRVGRHGVMRDILDWCFRHTDNLRIDTHRDNAPMRHCLVSAGFTYCGIIHLQDGAERLAFQRCVGTPLA